MNLQQKRMLERERERGARKKLMGEQGESKNTHTAHPLQQQQPGKATERAREKEKNGPETYPPPLAHSPNTKMGQREALTVKREEN